MHSATRFVSGARSPKSRSEKISPHFGLCGSLQRRPSGCGGPRWARRLARRSACGSAWAEVRRKPRLRWRRCWGGRSSAARSRWLHRSRLSRQHEPRFERRQRVQHGSAHEAAARAHGQRRTRPGTSRRRRGSALRRRERGERRKGKREGGRSSGQYEPLGSRGQGVSPTALMRATLAWFAARFTKACSCPPLDVKKKLEGERVECGRCGAGIGARP